MDVTPFWADGHLLYQKFALKKKTTKNKQIKKEQEEGKKENSVSSFVTSHPPSPPFLVPQIFAQPIILVVLRFS